MPGKNVRKRRIQRSTSRIQDWLHEAGEQWELWPEQEEALRQWGRNGLTQTEIAANMGISLSTLRAWQKKCPALSAAIKNARACADARVENALFVKAVGYTKILRKPVKVRRWKVENGRKVGEEEVIEYAEEEVHVPPDVAAIAFYLKNRLPDAWKERRIDLSDEEKDDAGMLCMQLMTEAEIKAKQEKPEEGKRKDHEDEKAAGNKA